MVYYCLLFSRYLIAKKIVREEILIRLDSLFERGYYNNSSSSFKINTLEFLVLPQTVSLAF